MKKTFKLFSLMATLALALVSKSVWADAAATPAPTPAVSVNGFVDGYYSYNFTNGANGAVGKGNVGTFFNTADDSFSLGLAEVDVNAVMGTTSAHVSLDFGQEVNLGLASGTAFGTANVPIVVPVGGVTTSVSVPVASTVGLSTGLDLLQAYVSYAPPEWTFNLGRFVTWMGNEVIQSKNNWNYSRSLLFWYTIPLWHQGISAGYLTSDSKFGATAYITDGWNNSGVPFSALDGADLGKTYGLQVKYVPDANFSVILNGIMGPNNGSGAFINPDQNKYVGEAIISFVPNGGAWSFALDAEMGGTNMGAVTVTANDGTTKYSSAPFWGAALYGRYQISSDWAAALRLEQVVDTYGYALGLYGLAPQFNPTSGKGTNDVTADEGTLTVEHNFSSNMLLRLEGRLDMATSGGTAYGAASTTAAIASTFAGASGSQFTGTASMVMSF